MFASYLMGIVGAVVMTTIIDVVMSEGETKKYVKGIAGLLILASVIVPLPSIIRGFDLSDLELKNVAIATQNNDGDYLQRVYESEYKSKELYLQNLFKAKGYNGITVRISLEFDKSYAYKIVGVEVDKSLMSLSDGVDNMDIDSEIVSIVENYLNVENDKIYIVG